MKDELLVATIVIALSVLGPAGAGAMDDELPSDLKARLTDPSNAVAIHIQWAGARQLPVVERVLEQDEERMYYWPLSSVFSDTASTVDSLPFEVGDITDVWLASKRSSGIHGAKLWIRTTLDEDRLTEELSNTEWEDLGGDHFGVLPPPERLAEFDAHFDELRGHMHPTEEEINDFRASLMEPLAEIQLIGDGWLVVSPDVARREPTDENSVNDQDSTDPKLHFPMSELVDLAGSTLIAMAVNVPDNDEAVEFDSRSDRPPEDTIEDIRRRIDEIDNRTDPFESGYLADFLVTIQELDGSLAIDVVARRPGGGGETETADFLDMILLSARVAAATDRTLSQELGSATVTRGTGEVRAECILSQTTLIDAFEERVRRQTELRELYQRLHELIEAQYEGS